MKKMQIFEPAMCCPTGICGVGVDPELLRISTVLNSMKQNGVVVERYNLSNFPQMFVEHKIINDFINTKGVEVLPVTIVDDEIVITGRYPKNEEFVTMLEIPAEFLGTRRRPVRAPLKRTGGCNCSDGKCC